MPQHSFLTGAAQLAGVMGWPIDHSLSPRLHGMWMDRYHIDGVYVPLPVRPEDLVEALEALPKLGFRGVNITFPHKQNVLSLVHRSTAAARRIGAVNTVVVDTGGRLIGSNTDAFGFLQSVREAISGWRADAGPAVILGAGGAARAVVFALIEEGVPEVRLLNRTLVRGDELATDLGGPIRVLPWAERASALAGAALLVNTTTLGMRHQPPLDVRLDALPGTAVVCDIIYAPAVTPLLADAARRGNPTVGGLGMLLHQARPGFAAWFGTMPDVTDEIRAALSGAVAEA